MKPIYEEDKSTQRLTNEYLEIDQEQELAEEETPEINLDLERQRSNGVAQCRDWYDTDVVAKQPITAEFDEMYKLFKGDHWKLLDHNGQQLRTDAQMNNHPNTVENVTFSLIEGLVAEFSEPKDLIDYPQEEGDDDAAITMSDLKEFIAYKNRHTDELVKWLRWFFLYGTGIWATTWDPNWKGGKGPNRWNGEIRWEAKHPRSIFPDARCMDTIEDGRRIHEAVYYTLEAVEETWPDAKGITPDFVSDDVVVSDELEYTTAESIEDQVLVVSTWYKGLPLIMDEDEEDQGPGLHLIQWAGEGTLKYLSHSNYCYFDPGEDVKFPYHFKKCYERERSPWGMSEAMQLKSPQICVNKNAEMIMEGHLYEAVGQTWFEVDALSEKQKRIVRDKGTLYGMWFEVLRKEGIHREYGRGVPASLQNEAGRLPKVMESIVGRYDISQGRTPGSITAFRALDLLASRAQVRLKSKEAAINSAREECGNYINRLIAKFYDGKRRYRILGKDDGKLKFGEYNGEAMKRAYFFDTGETMPYSELEPTLIQQQEMGLPPEQQLTEGEDFEVYSPEFDTKCKTANSLPTDRAFYMEMAKELLMNQLIDQETFFYVLDNGKFPPWEKLLEKLQQPPMGMGAELMPPADPQQQVDEFIQVLKAQRPDLLQGLMKLPDDAKVPALLEMMKQLGPELSKAAASAPAPTPAPPGQADIGGIPPQANAQALKQQMIDLLEAQKGAQVIEQ